MKSPIPILSPARTMTQLRPKYKPPRVPATAQLGKAGRRLWVEIQKEYCITDPGGVTLLLSAAKAEDDLMRMRAIVAKDGDTIKDRFGQKVAHPLLLAIRGSEAIKRQSIGALHLDLEPVRDKPGRPSGR